MEEVEEGKGVELKACGVGVKVRGGGDSGERELFANRAVLFYGTGLVARADVFHPTGHAVSYRTPSWSLSVFSSYIPHCWLPCTPISHSTPCWLLSVLLAHSPHCCELLVVGRVVPEVVLASR